MELFNSTRPPVLLQYKNNIHFLMLSFLFVFFRSSFFVQISLQDLDGIYFLATKMEALLVCPQGGKKKKKTKRNTVLFLFCFFKSSYMSAMWKEQSQIKHIHRVAFNLFCIYILYCRPIDVCTADSRNGNQNSTKKIQVYWKPKEWK